MSQPANVSARGNIKREIGKLRIPFPSFSSRGPSNARVPNADLICFYCLYCNHFVNTTHIQMKRKSGDLLLAR